ncbi:MAG: purine-nucleoside phosphorylase [Clostridiales bacterium]|jgi:purine-nucleoside phosphorylase|nr:purine-nucleoside phosphorylase [Clostridiales bacterium]
MKQYSTPHIDAAPEDFAPVVLMPGDPLRAKYIAENFLTDPLLINDVRGVQGYTGSYQGRPISVMASGMGMPSMGIYSYELFNFFGVEAIIRVGSAGAMQESVRLRDIVIGQGACTDSAFSHTFQLPGTFAPLASYRLLEHCVDAAKAAGLPYHVGNLLSSDIFYHDDPDSTAHWSKMGVLAVEMEAAALYMNAARAGKHGLALCTVSDHLLTGEATTAKERQTSFTDMIRLALDTAARI